MSETITAQQRRLGIVLALIANGVWGGAAFYWLETQPVSSIDVLAQRAAWTAPAVFCILLYLGRVRSTLVMLRDPKVVVTMAAAAGLISINWGVFLYAVTHGYVTEASLGYFLLPILSVLLGIVVFRESPTFPQKVAIAMALLAVLVQLLAVGGIPIISLALSCSFAVYAVIRKRVRADAIEGLFLESLFLLGPGAIWIALHGGAGLGQHGLKVDLFLLLSGAFTAIPLITHVTASRLLPLSTMGLFAYIGPSLQLIVAQTWLGESITPLSALSFGLVWLGLGFIVFDNLRTARRVRRLRQSS